MVSSVFHKFINLIDFDQKISSKESIIQRLEVEIGALKDKIDLTKDSFNKLKLNLREAQKDVDSKELLMNDLDNQLEEKKKLLDKIKNQKEYDTVIKEMKILKKQQYDYEKVLVAVWSKLDGIKKEYEKSASEYSSNIESLGSSLREKEKEKTDLEYELVSIYKDRPSIEKGVPEDWLEKYSVMRGSVSNPVVYLLGGACSACFYNLSAQDILDLKKNKLLQCKNCYRFLYMKTEETGDE